MSFLTATASFGELLDQFHRRHAGTANVQPLAKLAGLVLQVVHLAEQMLLLFPRQERRLIHARQVGRQTGGPRDLLDRLTILRGRAENHALLGGRGVTGSARWGCSPTPVPEPASGAASPEFAKSAPWWNGNVWPTGPKSPRCCDGGRFPARGASSRARFSSAVRTGAHVPDARSPPNGRDCLAAAQLGTATVVTVRLSGVLATTVQIVYALSRIGSPCTFYCVRNLHHASPPLRRMHFRHALGVRRHRIRILGFSK